MREVAAVKPKGWRVFPRSMSDLRTGRKNYGNKGLICCVGVYKINQSFEMNDAFWHIKTGEWIVQHGMVKNCIGSWIIGDKPWMAHEWLFGVLIYLVSCMGMRWIVIGCHLLYLIVVY